MTCSSEVGLLQVGAFKQGIAEVGVAEGYFFGVCFGKIDAVELAAVKSASAQLHAQKIAVIQLAFLKANGEAKRIALLKIQAE